MGRCGCCRGNKGKFCTSVIFTPLIKPTGSNCWYAGGLTTFVLDPILYSSGMFSSGVKTNDIFYNFCNCGCTNYFKNLNINLDDKKFITDDFKYVARDLQNPTGEIPPDNCNDLCITNTPYYNYIRNVGVSLTDEGIRQNINSSKIYNFVSLSGTNIVPYTYYSQSGYISYNKDFSLVKRHFSIHPEKYLTASSDLCKDEVIFSTNSYIIKPSTEKRPCDYVGTPDGRGCSNPLLGCFPYYNFEYVSYISKQKIEPLQPIKMDLKNSGIINEKQCRAITYPILYKIKSAPEPISYKLKTLSKVSISQTLIDFQYANTTQEDAQGLGLYPISNDSEMKSFLQTVANYGVSSAEYSLVPNGSTEGCSPAVSYISSGVQEFPYEYLYIPPPNVDDFNLDCCSFTRFNNVINRCTTHIPKQSRVLGGKFISSLMQISSFTVSNTGAGGACNDTLVYIDSSGNAKSDGLGDRPTYCSLVYNDIPNYSYYSDSSPDLSTIHRIILGDTYIPFGVAGGTQQEYLNESTAYGVERDQYLVYSGTKGIKKIEKGDMCAFFEDSIEFELSITVDLGGLLFLDSPFQGNCNPDDNCQRCTFDGTPRKAGWIKNGNYWFIPWGPINPDCGRQSIQSPGICKSARATGVYNVKVTIS